jgi:DUF1680 family protein
MRDRFQLNRGFLLAIDADALLHPYRRYAGLDAPGASLGGWYKGFPGHYLGHWLAACAWTFATDPDQAVLDKANHVVAELNKCQSALRTGYVLAYPEECFDTDEGGLLSRHPVPYYVAHKMIMGLYEMYRWAGNAQALDILCAFVDYLRKRFEGRHPSLDVINEAHGLSEYLYLLSKATGDERYLAFAISLQDPEIVASLAEGVDILTGMHANTMLPAIHSAAQAYEVTGKEVYRRAVANFERMVRARTFATGGSSNEDEKWGPPYTLERFLSSRKNQETCTSYNMMRVHQYLLAWTGDTWYADAYERLLYSSILPIQNERNGQFAYQLPLGYGNRGIPYGHNEWWCCYGTASQAFANLAAGIYAHDQDSIYVTLFVPSEVRWEREDGTVSLHQVTEFPASGKTELRIRADPPTDFGVKVRVPQWLKHPNLRSLKSAYHVKVNGAEVPANIQDSWTTLRRTWKSGDAIEIDMDVPVYTENIVDSMTKFAFLYGPVMLAAATEERISFERGSLLRHCGFANQTLRQVRESMTHIEGETLRFRPIHEDIVLKPLFDLQAGERYQVYFDLLP